MRLRSLLLSLSVMFAFAVAIPQFACASETPTEAAALTAAHSDHSAYTLSPEKLAKAESLYRFRVTMNFASPIWGIVSILLMLQLGIVARIRDIAVNISPNRWAQGFAFLLLFLLVSTALSLPLDLYAHSVQRAYGLSVQGWGSWFADQGKSFALTYVLGGLGVMLLFWLIRKFPKRWWIALWFPVMAFAVFGVFISPYVIDPLFNKFEPLQQTNPDLVAQLEKVVAKGDGIVIPPERMFLMKASDKVTTLNAYVTGFGASKRVVVWDTSIAKGTPDEILFIFGHEMGHYVLGHIVRGILFSFVLILIEFFLGFHLFQLLLRKFGAKWGIPSQDNWGALGVFVLVLSVLGFLSTPIANSYTRTQEHAADVYGMEVVHGIVANPQASGQAAFQLLGENSFAYPYPSAAYEFWTGSHPPIWLRAGFAKYYNPWAPGEEPKYFKK
jgi:Zn-dependent protease with chaperone function